MNTMYEQEYKELTEAIIVQAGIDYLKALRILDICRDIKSARNRAARRTIQEIRKFFKSKWYEELSSDTDGKSMLLRLNRWYREMRESGKLNRIRYLERS